MRQRISFVPLVVSEPGSPAGRAFMGLAERTAAQLSIAAHKVAEANKVEEQIVAAGKELQMLIDVVTNLKIEDTTVTTAIVENISRVYATLNQARALLRQRRKELLGTESAAEFAHERA